MHRLTIDDLSFCVVETAKDIQVCGGNEKTVYSGTGFGTYSTAYDRGYVADYITGYSVDKTNLTYSAEIGFVVAYGTAAGIAAAVSDGYAYANAYASVSIT
ncbi:hypothetical protein NIES4071_75100 [Calothrix sp. NIES-4071]|nr:hypothetical protein NIES4071_75100 [Calothrix sp. NIES-4071]BAZ61785.1 hypothetical protein NIES4105_75050 [Calothrix sp. NIES-4105]